MTTLLTISGSPFPDSRTEHAAALVERAVAAAPGVEARRIAVRDLPAEALIRADFRNPEVVAALRAIAEADAILIASPVYKAAYTGVLKTLLDLLPPDAIAGTPVAAVLSGGAPAHGPLAISALGALLDALGAGETHPPVFALDTALVRGETGDGITVTDPATAGALDATAAWLTERLTRPGAA